jgi:hypothetical protein
MFPVMAFPMLEKNLQQICLQQIKGVHLNSKINLTLFLVLN